jgi:hypothetical protein
MNSDLGSEVMRSLAVIHELDNQQDLQHAMFTTIQGEVSGEGHDHSAHGDEHKSQVNNHDDIKNTSSPYAKQNYFLLYYSNKKRPAGRF